MTVKRFVIEVVFMLVIVSQAAADVTSEDIAGAIEKKLTHPYLYFSNEDKPEILARIKNDTDFNF